jgi:hypothetical protein
MKRIILLLAIIGIIILQSCTVNEGRNGQDGLNGQNGYSAESEVFEIKNTNFSYSASNGYNIYRQLNPQIRAADVLLIYRLSGTINPTTPIWQQIPRTLYVPQGELDYDFDFSKQDFTIYAGGNYNLNLTPNYIQNQTFRIVIVPGTFSGKSSENLKDLSYDEVIEKYNIDDSHVKVLD